MILLALVLVGCGKSFGWEGVWKGDRHLKTAPGENPGVSGTLGKVELRIKNGRFELKETGIPITGTIRYDGEKAFLKIETRMNIPVEREPAEVQKQLEKEIELTSTKEGKIDFFDPGGFFTDKVTLERSEGKP